MDDKKLDFGKMMYMFGEALTIVKLVADKQDIHEEDQERAQILIEELRENVGNKTFNSFFPS